MQSTDNFVNTLNNSGLSTHSMFAEASRFVNSGCAGKGALASVKQVRIPLSEVEGCNRIFTITRNVDSSNGDVFYDFLVEKKLIWA